MSLESDWSAAKPDLSSEWEKAKPDKGAAPAAPAAQPLDVQRDILSHTTPSFAEPIGAGAMGMVAPTIANIAGLGSMPLHAMGLMKTDPQQVKENVQRFLTPEPQTSIGKLGTEALSIPGQIIGKGAQKIEHAIEPPPGAGDFGAEVQRGVARGAGEAFQQAPGVLGAKMGATAESRLPARQAALDVAKGESSVTDATRAAAQRSGYIIPPERGLQAAAAGLTGKTKTEKIISTKNAETATRNLSKEVGAAEGSALSEEEFTNLKRSAGESYEQMTSAVGPKLEIPNDFRLRLQNSLAQIDEALNRNREANRPLIPAQRLLKSFEKQTDFPTAATLKDIQNQRKWAKGDFRGGNDEMGTARLGVASMLEDLFADNLGRQGNQVFLDQFKAARERFAKIYLLERVTNDATGVVDLQKLASLSNSPAYKGVLSGEFKTAADFANAYRYATRKPTGEAAPRLTVFDGLFGIGAFASGHPLASALELGGRLAVPAMAERGMLQNRPPSYQANMMPARVPQLLGPITSQGQTQQ